MDSLAHWQACGTRFIVCACPVHDFQKKMWKIVLLVLLCLLLSLPHNNIELYFKIGQQTVLSSLPESGNLLGEKKEKKLFFCQHLPTLDANPQDCKGRGRKDEKPGKDLLICSGFMLFVVWWMTKANSFSWEHICGFLRGPWCMSVSWPVANSFTSLPALAINLTASYSQCLFRAHSRWLLPDSLSWHPFGPWESQAMPNWETCSLSSCPNFMCDFSQSFMLRLSSTVPQTAVQHVPPRPGTHIKLSDWSLYSPFH